MYTKVYFKLFLVNFINNVYFCYLMDNEKKTIVIHTRVPKRLEEELRGLVEDGYYSNVSDALRDASRKLIEFYKKTGEEKPNINFKTIRLK